MDLFKKLSKKFWSKIKKNSKRLTSKKQPTNKFEQILISSSPEEYKKAAVDYLNKLRPSDYYYLYTKPFDYSKEKSTSCELFANFANLLEILSLPPRSKILDVACGPGWLCEFLARSGYNVTGIDISPDLIQIAKERIEAIKFGPEEGKPPKVQFLVSDMETMNLDRDQFHTAILYDSLHHFLNPHAALSSIFKVIKPGGKLFIREGVKPPQGSEAEKNLIETMVEYGTLEKPFDQSELFDLLSSVGFIDIQAYEFVNLTVKRNGNRIIPSLSNIQIPETNTILAYKPGIRYDSQTPNILKGNIKIIEDQPPTSAKAGSTIQLKISIKNMGDTLWLSNQTLKWGFVTLGTKLLDKEGHLISDTLDRTMLPKNLHPGQKTSLLHNITLPTESGKYKIQLDLVDEMVTWFEEVGSSPYEFNLIIKQ